MKISVLCKGIDDCIDCPGSMAPMIETTGLMENDKNPDIIPVQKRGEECICPSRTLGF